MKDPDIADELKPQAISNDTLEKIVWRSLRAVKKSILYIDNHVEITEIVRDDILRLKKELEETKLMVEFSEELQVRIQFYIEKCDKILQQ